MKNLCFKIGDKVKIHPDSPFYYQAPDQIGEIRYIESSWARVFFEKSSNSYRVNGGPDLEPGDDLILLNPVIITTVRKKRSKCELSPNFPEA
jgi:hypothetical protein